MSENFSNVIDRPDAGSHHPLSPPINFGIEPNVLLNRLTDDGALLTCNTQRAKLGVAKLRVTRTDGVLPKDDVGATLTSKLLVRTRVAASTADLRAAHVLVRQRYAWRGYDVPEQAFAHGDLCGANRVVFVAKSAHAVVGTVTLGIDGGKGLLAEGTYPEPIGQCRERGAKVCEVTRLAVAENADSKAVLASLFSLAYATAELQDVTDVFVEVNPRHVVFYRRVLGFEVAAGERFCERVKAPSVLLWLTMTELESRLRRLNAGVSATRSYKDALAA